MSKMKVNRRVLKNVTEAIERHFDDEDVVLRELTRDGETWSALIYLDGFSQTVTGEFGERGAVVVTKGYRVLR